MYDLNLAIYNLYGGIIWHMPKKVCTFGFGDYVYMEDGSLEPGEKE